MEVPFLDLKTQYRSIEPEILSKVSEILSSGSYIMGPYVAAFEKEFAQIQRSQFAISTNNGTSALHLILWALGIRSGDEVIVPVNTFIATAEAVVLTGATPVFVDHDEYYNLDESKVEAAITPRTKAIIAVHLYGQISGMERLASIANKSGIYLVEDAAQAHLAEYKGGLAGSWGIATAFSFYPGKNLGAYGEAGAVLTNDPELDQKMRLIRDHGSESKYNHTISGHNYRLEALQAGILSVKLKYLKKWTASRRVTASLYAETLSGLELDLPRVHTASNPAWHLYVVQSDSREALQDHLSKAGIGTGLHYPRPLHLQKAFEYLNHGKGFPNAETCAPRLLSLPMFPELLPEQVSYVANVIREFHNR